MTTFIAVTREDFVKIGKSNTNDRTMGEADRMIPLATSDILVLGKSGYGQSQLGSLSSLRDQLCAAVAACRHLRGEKKGTRIQDIEAVKEGRYVLRCGIAMAISAVAQQPVPDGDAVQEFQQNVSNFTEQVKALSGRIGNVSSIIRTRLSSLKSILERPEFAPPKKDAAARAEFMTRLDAVEARLTSIAESKKSMQDDSKEKTVEVAELRGRLCSNLRLLSRVGKAAFRNLGDAEHATLYVLQGLSKRPLKKSTSAPASPAVPTPAGNVSPPPAPVPQPVTPTQQ